MLANPGSAAPLPWVNLPLRKFGGDSSHPSEVAWASLRFGGTGWNGLLICSSDSYAQILQVAEERCAGALAGLNSEF